MKILSVKTKRARPRAIRSALRALRAGGVVVFPTETAYGLAADVTNKRALQKIYRIKGRAKSKQLSWIVSSRAMAERYVRMTPLARKLARRYWPGPLTLVLKRKGHRGTTALRVSSHPVARALARGLGRPITATSANLAGKKECYTVKDVLSQLHGSTRLTTSGSAGFAIKGGHTNPDLALDAGRLPKRKPTTIVDVTANKYHILRKGSITLKI